MRKDMAMEFLTTIFWPQWEPAFGNKVDIAEGRVVKLKETG